MSKKSTLVAGGLCLIIGYAMGSVPADETETVTVRPGAGPTKTKKAAGPARTSTSREGTLLVGEDIAPGTWRTGGGEGCYWARHSTTLGDGQGILANNFGPGQQVVTIKASDVAFETRGCGEWEKQQ